jgi:hypothetical protein
MNKQVWLERAEMFDTWRVVPRSVLFGYAWWVTHVTDSVLSWYEGLPSSERTLEASGLAGAIITAITGLAVYVYKIYSDSANDWNSRGSSITSTQTVIKNDGKQS